MFRAFVDRRHVAVVFTLFAGSTATAASFPGPDAFGYTGVRTNNLSAFNSIKGNGGTLLTPADPAAAPYDDRF
jgi:hypothetical protein